MLKGLWSKAIMAKNALDYGSNGRFSLPKRTDYLGEDSKYFLVGECWKNVAEDDGGTMR